MVKAIETTYQGYRFRSRLEARWAVFFDTLNIKWVYEPQGYKTDNYCYLPDFQLKNVGRRSTEQNNLYVEVKGEEPDWGDIDEEIEKVVEFVKESKVDMAILSGKVGNGFRYGSFNHEYSCYTNLVSDNTPTAVWDNYMKFMRCQDCGRIKYEFQEINYMVCEVCGGRATYKDDMFVRAVENARSARFEHGQKPTI